MSLRDRNMDWLRKHVFIYPNQFYINEVAAADATVLKGVTATAPALTETSTLDVLSILFASDGDEVTAPWNLPFDMDPSFSVKLRVHACWSSTTGTDNVLFKAFINNAKGAAAFAKPATAVDTQFAAVTPGYTAAWKHFKTGWAVIAADKWTRAEVEAAHFVPILIESDTCVNSQNATNVNLLALEISYVPQFTRGGGSVRDVDAAS